jgi:3-oxoacyl-[acyl-carrier protein] reductase
MRLNNKVALITGAARGIGLATARRFAEEGATVVLGDVDAAEGNAVVEKIQKISPESIFAGLDVTRVTSIDSVVAMICARFTRIDILVNNAGIARDQLLLRVSAEEIAETFAINVTGAIYCAKAAIRPMMRARAGRIVNVTSVVAELGNTGQSVYGASKAALIGLTKSLAREYASRSVTVNAVAPGFIDTDMTSSLPAEAKKWILDHTPLGRVGKPEEVGAAVLFLCSDEASFITGQVLRVNGGMYV